MLSSASMVLRAARSALVPLASRRAAVRAVARSCSGLASDLPLLGSSSNDAPSPPRPNPGPGNPIHGGLSPDDDVFRHHPSLGPAMVDFVVGHKDVKSEVALWDLYHRWCRAYHQERPHHEMLCRFPRFKSAARKAYREKDVLSPFADGKQAELRIAKYTRGKSRRSRNGYGEIIDGRESL